MHGSTFAMISGAQIFLSVTIRPDVARENDDHRSAVSSPKKELAYSYPLLFTCLKVIGSKESHMQTIQEVPAPSSGKIAFQHGLIFGISLGVIEAVIQGISTSISLANMGSTYTGGMGAQTGVSLILGIVGFLLALAAYFLVGMMASKKTGKVSTGTLAGLWTGLFYGVIGFVVGLILVFTLLLPKLSALESSTGAPSSSYEVVRAAAITGGVIGAVFGIAIALGIGAGMGALGGLVGKSSSNVARDPAYPHYPPYSAPPQPYPVQGQPYPEQPYPAQPYPGQPYPGQPTPSPYPPQPYADQPYPPAQPPYPPDGGQYPPAPPSVPPTQAARPDQPYNPYQN